MPLYVPNTSAGALGLVGSWTYASNVPQVDFAGLGSYSEILIVTNGITKSVSGETGLRVSTNNGSSFFSGASDYERTSNDGLVVLDTIVNMHNTVTTAARSTSCSILASNVAGVYKVIHRSTRAGDGETCRFIGSTDPINAIRILPSGGGNFTAGNIQIFAR